MLNTMFHLIAKVICASAKAKHEFIDGDIYVSVDGVCFDNGRISHFTDGFTGREEIDLTIDGHNYKWVSGQEPTEEAAQWITWAADWLLD